MMWYISGCLCRWAHKYPSSDPEEFALAGQVAIPAMRAELCVSGAETKVRHSTIPRLLSGNDSVRLELMKDGRRTNGSAGGISVV